jgi:hypothetical protein
VSQKTNQLESILSVQNVILASIFWGLLALFIFLLGSPIVPRPIWYKSITYVLENTAFFAAMVLCFRNWQSSKIVSGRTVWLLFGLGMLCYFTANLLLGWWETTFGYAPDVSPADFLYLLSYLFLGVGMLMAVLSKQLNLSVAQWAVIASIAVIGVVIAYFVSGYAGSGDEATRPTNRPDGAIAMQQGGAQPLLFAGGSLPNNPGWIAQTTAPAPEASPAPPVEAPSPADPTVTAEPAEATEATPPPPEGTEAAGESPVTPAPDEPIVEEQLQDIADIPENAPTWMLSINELLTPYADLVWILYLVGDTFLVVMATTLLLAFWGGRFSLSWRFIAAAGLSLYIADMWYYYAIDNIENYATGALPEVFWIFSGVLLCIGASLEYSLSTRSRRSRRRA